MPKIYKREEYLKKIRGFYDDDMIKVISGIRRCGKSFFLKSIMQELIEKGVKEKDIIYIQLDKKGYKYIKTPEFARNTPSIKPERTLSLLNRVEHAEKELHEIDNKNINFTDPEARYRPNKDKKGEYGYIEEVANDAKYNITIAKRVTQDTNDQKTINTHDWKSIRNH